MLEIDIANEQRLVPIKGEQLRAAVKSVLAGECIREAIVSLAIVDDQRMQALNCRYLGHDEPTDVLSFVLEKEGDRLEGEIIVSSETAVRAAQRFGWSADNELLLYVIHGSLHLVGYDDTTPDALTQMREREHVYMRGFGLQSRYESSGSTE